MAEYTFQGQLIIAPVSFESEQKVLSTKTWSSREERVTMDGQRWRISFGLEPDEGASLLPHLVASFGDEFDFIVPQPDAPSQDNPNNALIVEGTSEIGTNRVDIKTSDWRNLINRGRFIKFGNHNKLYMVVNITSDAIFIYPNLVSEVRDGFTLFCGTENVEMRAQYDTSMTKGITFSDGLLSDPGTVTLVEAV